MIFNGPSFHSHTCIHRIGSHRQTVTETDIQYKAVIKRTDLEQCIEDAWTVAGGWELGHVYPMLAITRRLRSLRHTGYDADQHMDRSLIYHPNLFAAQVSESANTIRFAFIIMCLGIKRIRLKRGQLWLLKFWPSRGEIFPTCTVNISIVTQIILTEIE